MKSAPPGGASGNPRGRRRNRRGPRVLKGEFPSVPMPTPITPEHLQLLSDKRLAEAAREDDGDGAQEGDQETDGDDTVWIARKAMARAARYEIRRRAADVPVRDRFTSS